MSDRAIARAFVKAPSDDDVWRAWSMLHLAGVEAICDLSLGEIRRVAEGHLAFSAAEVRLARGLLILRAALLGTVSAKTAKEVSR